MKKIFLFISFILLLSLASASFNVSEESINDQYSMNDTIKGSIEISFENYPLNEFFTDIEDNKISLKEVLDASNYKYNCTNEGCESIYRQEDPTESKTFFLPAGEEKNFGIYLKGEIDSINSAEFKFKSNANESENNQLKIDILSDGKFDVGNTFSGTTSNIPNDGCYQSTHENIQTGEITGTGYCQKISLKEAPAYDIGAGIIEEDAGNANLTMELYGNDGTFAKSCQLQKSQINNGNRIYCRIDYPILEKENYYVCLSSDENGGNYKIKSYSAGVDGCGFIGIPTGQPERAAYDISARPLTFHAMDDKSILINDSFSMANTFSELIQKYITDEYGKTSNGQIDCTDGCIVPLKFSSFKNQTITLSQLLIDFDTDTLIGGELTNIYNISEVGSLINAEPQNLVLDNFFRLPNVKKTNWTYKLKLGNSEVFSTKISIKKSTIDLNIQDTAAGFPNNFIITSTDEVKTINWSFGDNSSIITQGPEATHKYITPGNYTLKAKIETTNGAELSKEFLIIVENPKKMVDSKIKELRTNYDKITAEIEKMDGFSQKIIEDALLLNETKAEISFLEGRQPKVKNPAEYNDLIAIIIGMSIPSSIYAVTNQGIPFYTEKSKIDLEAISAVAEEYPNITDEDSMKDKIAFWNQQNVKTRISSDTIFADENGAPSELATIYKIVISPKNSIDEAYYLIVKDAYGVKLKETSPISVEGYKAILLTNAEKTIYISSQDSDLSNLPIFISPPVSKLLSNSSITSIDNTSNKKFILLLLILLGLVFIGIITYLALQSWYKIKYEKYLFKDRNNLYNTIVYVNNAKKQGMQDDEIQKSLKRSGWSSEQIRYIMRKYKGKRTGMYEIFKKGRTKSTNTNRIPLPEKNPVKFSTNFKDNGNFRHKI